MKQDLLMKRLRDCGNGVGSLKSDRGDFGLCEDAADTIENLRSAILMAINTVGDLRKGFASHVEPERWVEQLQFHLEKEMNRNLDGLER